MSPSTVKILEQMRRDAARGMKAMQLLDHPAGQDELADWDQLIEQARRK